MTDRSRRGVPVFEGRHPAKSHRRPELPERDRGLAGQQPAGDRRLHGKPDGLRDLRHRADIGHSGRKARPAAPDLPDVRAATYLPGAGCPDGLHYDVKGNLWIAAGGLGGILQVDPRGIIIGFVPIRPDGDLSTTNFAFGGPDNRTIILMGANSGTFWRFKAPYPGLIGPGGVRLAAQP